MTQPDTSVSWSAIDQDGHDVPMWNQAWDHASPRDIGLETEKLAQVLPEGWTMKVEIEK